IVGNLATSAHRGASAVFPTIVVGDAPSGVSRHARPYRPREVAASHGRADPIIDVVGALVSSKGSSESIQPRSHAASSEEPGRTPTSGPSRWSVSASSLMGSMRFVVQLFVSVLYQVLDLLCADEQASQNVAGLARDAHGEEVERIVPCDDAQGEQILFRADHDHRLVAAC